jgi:putative peptidoglycan lipid II flippase
VLALRLPPGAVQAFRYALSIRDIPVSMFGIATSQAIFPSLSEKARKKDGLESFQILFSQGLRTILFWTLPITSLLLVLRTPYTRILFSLFTDKVTLRDASVISYALLFLSISIVFYSILNLVNRAFYSLDDSKTPTYVSVFTIFIEIALTYALVNLFSNISNVSLNPLIIFRNYNYYFINGGSINAVGGLALASTIAIFINLSILIFFLGKKKVKFFFQPEYILSKFASAFTMFVAGILSFKLFDRFFDLERTGGLLIFTANVTILMLFTYYICEKFVKDDDISFVDHPISRIKAVTKKILDLIRRRKLTGITTSQ